jgi:hypothetical protein
VDVTHAINHLKPTNMKCPNCGATLGCGCQKRVLANGKQGCAKCVNSLKAGTEKTTKPVINDARLDKL